MALHIRFNENARDETEPRLLDREREDQGIQRRRQEEDETVRRLRRQEESVLSSQRETENRYLMDKRSKRI